MRRHRHAVIWQSINLCVSNVPFSCREEKAQRREARAKHEEHGAWAWAWAWGMRGAPRVEWPSELPCSLSDSFACVPDLCVLYNKPSRSPLSSWTVFALFLEGINPGTGTLGHRPSLLCWDVSRREDAVSGCRWGSCQCMSQLPISVECGYVCTVPAR